MNMQLLKRAVRIFPKSECLEEKAVRHNRRKWLESVAYLRERNLWILDQPVRRQ